LPKTVVINGSYADSLVRFRGDFLRELVARGHKVHATAPDIDPATRSWLREAGVECHSVPLSRAGLNPLADLAYFRALRRLFRAIAPDLVLNYTIKPNIWGSFAAASAGVAAVSMVTGVGYLMIEGRGLKRRLIQALARRLYRAALARNRAVIFQNGDDVADFVSLGLVTPSQVRTVRGSGVNLQHFAPLPLPPAPVFLMIARLLTAKGVGEYAGAAAAAKRTVPEARFLLVGMTELGPDAIDPATMAEWPAQGIEYLGPLDDVRPALAQASVYVLPSYREGTPRSVLEAMATGRPVITTDVPGCRETVQDGENGLLVPAREAGPLREAMERLARDPDLRERMGQASLLLVRERFDVRAVNAQLIEHLEL
jgi:glycosyltransferase involved in cell wall biosynthesis